MRTPSRRASADGSARQRPSPNGFSLEQGARDPYRLGAMAPSLLPRRSILSASALALLAVPGCCGGDFRSMCQRQLVELSAVVDRAPPTLQAAARADHAALSNELATSPPGEPGNDARKKLSGRIAVAIFDWDKKIDEAWRATALKPLVDGKWIGNFWRNGATHLGVHVNIQADGRFANTRNDRVRGKVRLETDSGYVLRVRGNELTYKSSGAYNKERVFAPTTAPVALGGAQLGFTYGGDRYLLVPGS